MYSAGSSAVAADGAFHVFSFTSASVAVLGDAVAAQSLTLTITYTPTNGSSTLLYVRASAFGNWVRTDTGGPQSTSNLEYTYAPAVAADGVAVLPNGAWFENYAAGQNGTFHLTFAAPGFVSALASYTF